MRVLHTIQSLSREGAGVYYYLNDLTRWQRELGCEVTVVGAAGNGLHLDANLWGHATMEFVRPLASSAVPLAAGLQDILSRAKPDLIHCHGLWSYHSLAVPRFCRSTKTPFIVSPHGMLEPWAWRHHAWKKRPIWWLWERRFLRQANALHATARQEADNFRKLGLRNPVGVVPIGVELPPENPRPAIGDGQTGARLALFLSRIHPKKGLLNLVAAWAQVRPIGWRMLICGPDENGHVESVKRSVAEAGLSDVFDFSPPVYGREKASLFASADLFILPTFSENFGIVIAEALASGVPVITTVGAPWEGLRTSHCGWWVEFGVQPLAAALRQSMSLPKADLQQMGQRGRDLVRNKYSWGNAAKEMLAVYEWVFRRTAMPRCVLQS